MLACKRFLREYQLAVKAAVFHQLCQSSFLSQIANPTANSTLTANTIICFALPFVLVIYQRFVQLAFRFCVFEAQKYPVHARIVGHWPASLGLFSTEAVEAVSEDLFGVSVTWGRAGRAPVPIRIHRVRPSQDYVSHRGFEDYRASCCRR